MEDFPCPDPTINYTQRGMIESKMNYIHENPVKSGIVENPEDYLYSSARNYSRMKGVIEVEYW